MVARDAEALLRATTSNRVRNAAAIALADMRVPDAASSIIDVLRRPDLAAWAGTLLFALAELDALVRLDVIERGAFESRAEVIIAVDEGRVTAVYAVKAREERANPKRMSEKRDDAERAEAADEALRHPASSK